MLFQPPAVITVMEPWDGMRLPPAELIASPRAEIETTGMLRRGKLDVETLLKEGIVQWGQEGEVTARVEVTPDYLLGVKWPAYWRYLELLPETKFLVCVRHPLEVIGSYKKAGGRVAQGLQYETAFNRKLNEELEAATHNVALRRILLHDYINSRLLTYLSRPNVFVVRYERWFTEPEALLADLSAFLGTQLTQGAAALRPPRGKLELTEEETILIKQHCRTAEPLGYNLNNGVKL
jgi:hypothetical protein